MLGDLNCDRTHSTSTTEDQQGLVLIHLFILFIDSNADTKAFHQQLPRREGLLANHVSTSVNARITLSYKCTWDVYRERNGGSIFMGEGWWLTTHDAFINEGVLSKRAWSVDSTCHPHTSSLTCWMVVVVMVVVVLKVNKKPAKKTSSPGLKCDTAAPTFSTTPEASQPAISGGDSALALPSVPK